MSEDPQSGNFHLDSLPEDPESQEKENLYA